MERVPFQITAVKKGKVAKVAIIGEIGWEVNSSAFMKDVDALVKDGCTNAHLYINSVGGSVIDANEIANILLENFEEITGDGGAIVASAAAYLAVHCKTFTMPSNGQFMAHRPKGAAYGDVKDIEAYLKMVNDIDSEYLEKFKAKATDPDGFEKQWKSGADYWMNAKEAKDAGFVSSIREKVKADNNTTNMLRACAASVRERMSEFLTKENTNMEKLVALLQLPVGSSETDLVAAINNIMTAKNTAEKDLKTEQSKTAELQGKLDAIELKEKEALKAEASTLVDAALKDGRLSDNEKGSVKAFWLSAFEANHEGAKAALEALPKRTGAQQQLRDDAGEGETAWEKRQKEIQENASK